MVIGSVKTDATYVITRLELAVSEVAEKLSPKIRPKKPQGIAQINTTCRTESVGKRRSKATTRANSKRAPS